MTINVKCCYYISDLFVTLLFVLGFFLFVCLMANQGCKMFIHTVTRCEFELTDIPKGYAGNSESHGGNCMCLLYDQIRLWATWKKWYYLVSARSSCDPFWLRIHCRFSHVAFGSFSLPLPLASSLWFFMHISAKLFCDHVYYWKHLHNLPTNWVEQENCTHWFSCWCIIHERDLRTFKRSA